MREYLAIVICLVVGGAVATVAIALLRLVRPDAQLVRRDRLPAWWRSLTSWSRSRSLRLWCPNDATATLVAAHLRVDTGRRLSRLGVSIAPGPWAADVVVVERGDADRLDADRLDAERARAPQPVATIVLTDAGDIEEFRDALVVLAAALRWRDDQSAA
ncbi:MAG TPA: hypothetical protein VFN21_03715 [Acidimicrobiales bacterium]|nr:hypothetical protein [Acidimicrobiales bacterium]